MPSSNQNGSPNNQPDIELKLFPIKEDMSSSIAQGATTRCGSPSIASLLPRRAVCINNISTTPRRRRRASLRSWADGFRRDPNQRISPKDPMSEIMAGESGSLLTQQTSHNGRHLSAHSYDMRMAALGTAHSSLLRRLKGRHLQMIAIGGSIALGELAVAFPVAGSFSAYSTRFIDPSWGFAMGWNYALQWMVVLPLEIIAASITISFWNPDIDRAIFVSIFLVIIVFINLFGVKGYGEAEFIFAIIKVIAVIGFILLGVVLNIGGTPNGGYIGVLYWHHPGAFHNGFKGLCTVFVQAAFAFAGTELVGLAAAETMNPRKSLPTAIKQVFWRISLFYIVALTLVGLLVPYTDERLLQADDGDKTPTAAASPFVIAIENAGIEILPSVMNVVILIAVLSVGNSSVFGSSRTLAALADQKQAPKILSYVDRQGRPLVAILVTSSMGLLAFLADLGAQSTVLDWLLAISGLSSLFTWASICLAHIRFRRAWADQGHSLSELAFRSQCGVWGSWLGFGFNLLVLVTQFWVGAWPVGWRDKTPRQLAENFFLQYMAVPIVMVFYGAHRLYFRRASGIVRTRDIDIDTGRRDFNLPILVAQEAEERSGWPKWKKLYKFLC
ncbi:putative amino acid transport protein GAP1 [Apiospora kogelbergensis]|uniref:Amino acid transport protein GAP1 n=1 Tax=Apiospora kogelbergensis TaxID=1337665 RepID=A0AAW0Q601_9PEZI